MGAIGSIFVNTAVVFHKGHTVTAINRLWWFVDNRKEVLQIVGVYVDKSFTRDVT